MTNAEPEDTKTSLYRRWTQHWWSPLGLFLLLFLALLFHMVGRHMVRGVLQWVYTPPALTDEKAAVYTEFIRLVERHPEYTRVFLNSVGRLSAEPVVAEDMGFSESEVTALYRLAKRFRDVGCIFAERGESYIAFKPYPPYILPASPGVAFSLDGRHPNEIDDWFLNHFKPFVHITGRWYASRRLISSPYRTIDPSPLGESLIDRSLRYPSTLAE